MFSIIRKKGNSRTVCADPVYHGTLTNLHDSGWWTGTIIHAPARIKLTSKWHSFEWEQHNLFHPFPFPFPSWMAKDIDLQITVTSLSGKKINVMLYFHDLEAIKKDRYVFVDKGPVFHWNGCTADPSKLKMRTLHTVVPTITKILEGAADELMCVHSLTPGISDPGADC
jgi:hypothetical protein